MAILLEELLEVWREAERVLDQLPAGAPERNVIEVNVIELRSMHRLLTDQQLEQTDQLLASSREAIEAARRVHRADRGSRPRPSRRDLARRPATGRSRGAG